MSSNEPLRILYVEDNELVREQTQELLAAPGRDIVACESAEDALMQIENAAFDVIITDVSLPKMSGVELAKKAQNKAPDVEIVIVSGYALPQLSQLGPKVRVLTKPIETEQIEALLSDLRR